MMKSEETASGTKKYLHVGCGRVNPDRIPRRFQTGEWLETRLDIDRRVNPDIVADIRDLSMIPSESYDAVFSPHNIEHLRYNEVNDALRGFWRVIKPEGFLVLLVPNLRRVAQIIVDTDIDAPMMDTTLGPIAPVDVIYGFRPWIQNGNDFMIHKTGFTPESLYRRLKENGFNKIVVTVATSEIPYEHPFNMAAVAYKE